MNKSNEQSPSLKEEKRSILTRLLRRLMSSPTALEDLELKKLKKTKKELEEERKELEELKKELRKRELKIEELILRKSLDELDPDFDKKLECLLKTPPLKLKDLKEQLKREREGKGDSH